MIIVLIGSFIRLFIVLLLLEFELCWVVYVNMRPNLFVCVL